MKTDLYFLHGFLGLPTDWDSVRKELSQFVSHAPDYLRNPKLSPEVFIGDWGWNFNVEMAKMPTRAKKILIGYSMGGRLATEAFFAKNSDWDQLILVSANPSMDPETKAARPAFDSMWAKRFRSEGWESLLRDWNSQAIFSGPQSEPNRVETEFIRDSLAQCLENWSPAKQKDFLHLMNRSDIALIAGELDPKYLQISQKIKAGCPALKMISINNSAHRVLFDQPTELARVIRGLL